MSRVIEKTLYKFDELSDEAKERARDWYREGGLDYDWWDSVYEDADAVAEILGIDLRQKPVKLMSVSTRYDPAIYFSGFCSQGDGARFAGKYEYPKARVFNNGGTLERASGKRGKTPAQLIRDYAPKDTDLHAIADELQDLQRRNFYGLTAHVELSGRYEHSGCTQIAVYRSAPKTGDDLDVDEDTEEAVKSALRSFMDWIYWTLEKEHEYLLSDETVDDNMIANEYEFDEDGRRV